MSRSAKIVLGVATLWPVVYLFFFIGFTFYLLLPSSSQPTESEPSPWGVIVLFLLHILTILWELVLLVIYVTDVFRNDRVSKDLKVMWVVVLIFGNVIAMPIYWYLYIWSQGSRSSAPDGGMRNAPVELLPIDRTTTVEGTRSRSAKIVLGIATLFPVLFIGLSCYLLPSITFQPAANELSYAGLILFFVLQPLGMIWEIILLVIYIADVFKNNRLRKDTKVLWILGLFFGSLLAMPIYWYLYIWPQDGRTSTSAGPQAAGQGGGGG